MQTTVRTLKVFLASPGDVKPERAAADELVNEINKQLRAVGWQIMLYMWEIRTGFWKAPGSHQRERRRVRRIPRPSLGEVGTTHG